MNIFFTISTLLVENWVLFFCSLPITLYNIKSFITKNYKLYVALGEDNKKEYDKYSIKYKFKFMIYLIITIVALISLLFSLLYYFFERFLNNVSAIHNIFKLFGIF
jgi:hypothetical protein